MSLLVGVQLPLPLQPFGETFYPLGMFFRQIIRCGGAAYAGAAGSSRAKRGGTGSYVGEALRATTSISPFGFEDSIEQVKSNPAIPLERIAS